MQWLPSFHVAEMSPTFLQWESDESPEYFQSSNTSQGNERLKAHFSIWDTNSVGAALRTKRGSQCSQLWVKNENITTKQVSDYNHECYALLITKAQNMNTCQSHCVRYRYDCFLCTFSLNFELSLFTWRQLQSDVIEESLFLKKTAAPLMRERF